MYLIHQSAVWEVKHLSGNVTYKSCSASASLSDREITDTGKTPSNWQSFLRDENNNQELFHFIADKITEMKTDNIVIVTKGEDAVSNQAANLDGIAPCSDKEADTRIFLHAQHAVKQGHKSLMIDADMFYRTRESMWYPLLPCLHWLRHCVILPWQIEEVCLENIGRM